MPRTKKTAFSETKTNPKRPPLFSDEEIKEILTNETLTAEIPRENKTKIMREKSVSIEDDFLGALKTKATTAKHNKLYHIISKKSQAGIDNAKLKEALTDTEKTTILNMIKNDTIAQKSQIPENVKKIYLFLKKMNTYYQNLNNNSDTKKNIDEVIAAPIPGQASRPKTAAGTRATDNDDTLQNTPRAQTALGNRTETPNLSPLPSPREGKPSKSTPGTTRPASVASMDNSSFDFLEKKLPSSPQSWGRDYLTEKLHYVHGLLEQVKDANPDDSATEEVKKTIPELEQRFTTINDTLNRTIEQFQSSTAETESALERSVMLDKLRHNAENLISKIPAEQQTEKQKKAAIAELRRSVTPDTEAFDLTDISKRVTIFPTTNQSWFPKSVFQDTTASEANTITELENTYSNFSSDSKKKVDTLSKEHNTTLLNLNDIEVTLLRLQTSPTNPYDDSSSVFSNNDSSSRTSSETSTDEFEDFETPSELSNEDQTKLQEITNAFLKLLPKEPENTADANTYTLPNGTTGILNELKNALKDLPKTLPDAIFLLDFLLTSLNHPNSPDATEAQKQQLAALLTQINTFKQNLQQEDASELNDAASFSARSNISHHSSQSQRNAASQASTEAVATLTIKELEEHNRSMTPSSATQATPHKTQSLPPPKTVHAAPPPSKQKARSLPELNKKGTIDLAEDAAHITFERRDADHAFLAQLRKSFFDNIEKNSTLDPHPPFTSKKSEANYQSELVQKHPIQHDALTCSVQSKAPIDRSTHDISKVKVKQENGAYHLTQENPFTETGFAGMLEMASAYITTAQSQGRKVTGFEVNYAPITEANKAEVILYAAKMQTVLEQWGITAPLSKELNQHQAEIAAAKASLKTEAPPTVTAPVIESKPTMRP